MRDSLNWGGETRRKINIKGVSHANQTHHGFRGRGVTLTDGKRQGKDTPKYKIKGRHITGGQMKKINSFLPTEVRKTKEREEKHLMGLKGNVSRF